MKRKTTAAAADAAPPKPKAKPGLPPHVPTKATRKRVRLCASLGLTQEEIALLLDLGESALQKHYPKELRVGGLEADVKVLENLYRMASGTGPEAGRSAIFWAKVRRRWHEVQRVIHGYDPETIKAFVKGVVSMLKRELPECCPACKTKLNLPEKVAAHMYQLSQDMAAKLPPSEIVQMPTPQLASDGLGQVD